MDRKSHIFTILLSSLLGVSACAQVPVKPKEESTLLKHLDIGLDLGTTGLGLDLEVTLTPWMSARAGVNYMPRFNVPMTFGLETFDAGGFNTGKFAQMQELMKNFMGIDVDDRINMNAKCTMVDFKFLLDFKPIPGNDHWHAIAGFHYGSSGVGHIENTIYEMPTLVGVTMYNSMYDFFVNEEYWDKPIYNDIYLDPDQAEIMRDKFLEYGRVGVHLGDFTNTSPYWEKGKPYLLEPDKNCMVKANMRVNHFKPYLSLGYTTWLSADKKWKFGVDAGALFWGGTPSIVTHDNLNYAKNVDGTTVTPTVNLSKDVEGIQGKVGRYVDIAKALKVFPVLNVRFSYTIF